MSADEHSLPRADKALSIVVGSRNAVKVRAVREGFAKIFGQAVELNVEGVDAKSHVSDQPMTDEETLLGARNRAGNTHLQRPDADFWVGVEGGIEPVPKNEEQAIVPSFSSATHAAFAWIVILSRPNSDDATKGTSLLRGEARSCSFLLPTKVCELIATGMELGAADDLVFGTQNSKQASGAVGLLTNDAIDRCALYTSPTSLALIPHLNPALYPSN